MNFTIQQFHQLIGWDRCGANTSIALPPLRLRMERVGQAGHQSPLSSLHRTLALLPSVQQRSQDHPLDGSVSGEGRIEQDLLHIKSRQVDTLLRKFRELEASRELMERTHTEEMSQLQAKLRLAYATIST